MIPSGIRCNGPSTPILAGRSAMAAHLLWEQEAGGSIPPARIGSRAAEKLNERG